MTQSSLPYDNTPIANEDQWAAMARYWAGTGVVWGYSSQLNVYADSSGRQVKIQPGAAWVDGVKYVNDSEVIYPIDANTSGQPRIDRVVLRLDRSANSCLISTVLGEPNTSPTVPDLVDTSDVKYVQLAQVVVANGTASIASGSVTMDRVFSKTSNIGWQAWEPTISYEVGAGYTATVSDVNQSEFLLEGDRCTLSYVAQWSLNGGPATTGLSVLMKLPFIPRYPYGYVPASVQNGPGRGLIYPGDKTQLQITPGDNVWLANNTPYRVLINGTFRIAPQ